MTAPVAVMVSASTALIVGAVVLSVVVGAVDLLRQPTWAWRAAGEPKLLCLLLLLLLPGVGLAIYVFGTRPKLVGLTAAGRAANLPFERFGDQRMLATGRGRHIRALAQPTALGSFGEPLPGRSIKASGPAVGPSGGARFFDDPDLVTVGAPSGSVDPAPVATDAPPPEFHIPGSLGRPYHPMQRTSFEEGESMASVAAQFHEGSQTTGASAPVGPVASALPSVGAPPAPPWGTPPAVDPGPTSPVSGRSFAAQGTAQGPGLRHSAGRSGSLPLMATPLATPGSPEIFRPPPRDVAPISGSSPVATAIMTAPAPTMAARWLPDPTGRHQYRYWDSGSWTENVYDAGVESRDSVTD